MFEPSGNPLDMLSVKTEHCCKNFMLLNCLIVHKEVALIKHVIQAMIPTGSRKGDPVPIQCIQLTLSDYYAAFKCLQFQLF